MAERKYKLEIAVRFAEIETSSGRKERVKELNQKPVEFEKLMKKCVTVLRKNPLLGAKMNGGIIHAVLVNDEKIALLNALYRGKGEPTDVISLSYFDELNFPGENNLVGEIMISVDTARRQAKKHGHSLKTELRFLFAHGLLHLFGFDHQTAKEKKAMFALQDVILA
jgi:probable rRNA maturation factor